MNLLEQHLSNYISKNKKTKVEISIEKLKKISDELVEIKKINEQMSKSTEK